MALDAGSVFTILGGRFSPGGFKEFDAANKNSARIAAEAEAAIAASQGKAGKAHDAASSAASRAVSANEKLANSARRLGSAFPLAAMDLYAKHSDQAAKNVEKLGRVSAIGAGVGLATLAGATIYAAKTAGDFEKQMRNVNSIAKLSESGYRSLSKGVLSLAGDTAQAPKVLAEGLYQLVSSGFNAKDSLTILQSSAKAATAGLTDTATATTAVAAVLNAYRLPASQASQVSDTLFETVNRGVLTFDELSKHIGDVLPFASALGVSLPEVGAAISTMTKEGINAPETMTRIKREMQSFIKPSKDMTAAIKQTGASSAEALVKQKGLQGAIEAVAKTTDGSKASLAKLFPDIRALGGALALTGKNAKAANQDLAAFKDTGGATAKVFAEQAKGAEFAGKRLTSSFQTAAIIVGNQVLPALADGANKLTQALQGAVKDGSLASFGQGLMSVFGTLGQVVGNVAPAIAGIARALAEVGKAVGLGNATELTALIASFAAFKTLTFIGPIVASVVGAISELGLALATAPSMAAFGADIIAMTGPIGLIAGAVALAAGAFVAFNGGLFSSASAAEKNAAALQADKAAVEGLAGATQNAASAHTAAERATLTHKEAVENLKKTEKEAAAGTIKGTAAQNALLSARLRVAESSQQVEVAHQKATKALADETHQSEKAQKTIGSRQQETLKELATLERESQLRGNRNFILANGERADERRNKLQREYNQQAREAAQATAQVAVAEESRRRIEAGRGAITAKNAQGVAQLQNALFESGVPKKIVTKYELDDQGAQAKLGALSAQLTGLGQQKVVAKILTTAPSAGAAIVGMRAILAGVPRSKVVSILHNAPSAKSAMGQLKAAIAAVQAAKHIAISTNAAQARAEIASVQSAVAGLSGKTIAIAVQKTTTSVENVVRKAVRGRASGRGKGGAEVAMVGEGKGSEYVIDRSTGHGAFVSDPTVMGLGPNDYVVPLEEQYRGRAMGLFAMLAKDLGVPGYAKGRKPSGHKPGGHAAPKRHYTVPNAIAPLSLPLQDIESKRDAVKSAEDKVKTKVKSEAGKVASLEKSIRTAERAKKPNRAKLHELHDELAKAKKAHQHDASELAKDKRELQAWNRTVREAKRFQTEINKRTLEANNAGTAMKIAADHDDPAAYEAAKGKRLGALGALQKLIKEAQAQVKTGTEYALQLEGQVQQAEQETGTTEHEELEAPRDKAAEEEASTGMTAAERSEQKRIERDIALAALTQDLGDDKAHAQELVSFLEKILGETKAEPDVRGGDEGITQIANALKTAQGNLASLSGSGTNENSDLQAQINQSKERAEVEKRRADIAEQSLAVFGGAGDIGAGGRNAAAAASQHFTINTLHPGDPQTLSAIGTAATAGIGLQGNRQAVRVQVGP